MDFLTIRAHHCRCVVPELCPDGTCIGMYDDAAYVAAVEQDVFLSDAVYEYIDVLFDANWSFAENLEDDFEHVFLYA